MIRAPLATMLTDGPEDAALTVVLAHGAGAAMDSPFMAYFADGLAAAGFRVVRFEFPYMARRREDGRKRPPDRAPVLLASWREVAARFDPARLVVGGKSLGGRMASLIADEVGARGLVCLGYPFHPPGRPETTRVAHLATLATPTLIVQGTRDPFGSPAEVAGYPLSPQTRVAWIAGGDHGLAPGAGGDLAGNLATALREVVAFLRNRQPR